MKFMNTINELQKKLTKLRREIQRSEARPEGPKCSTCGKSAVGGQGTALQATVHFCEDHRPTAGECRCNPHDQIYWSSGHKPQCPKNPGWKGITLPAFDPKPTPDLPLHVRVAKTLGWIDINKGIFGSGGTNWYGRCNVESSTFEHIPNYSNDLVAAMGALEEYTKSMTPNSYFKWGIQRGEEGRFIIAIQGNRIEHRDSGIDSLPQVICEAIVAYAEDSNG